MIERHNPFFFFLVSYAAADCADCKRVKRWTGWRCCVRFPVWERCVGHPGERLYIRCLKYAALVDYILL